MGGSVITYTWSRVAPFAVPVDLSMAVAAALLELAPEPWPAVGYFTADPDDYFRADWQSSGPIDLVIEPDLIAINASAHPDMAAAIVAVAVHRLDPEETH